MLYNLEKKKVQSPIDCTKCPYKDKKTKLCTGINKCCFEYDSATKTIIDGVTKMPMKVRQ